jgi:DnaK suppressor protein
VEQLNVLIIDDEEAVREGVRMVLEYDDMNVDEAATGEDGLKRIEDGSYGLCLNCEEPISPKRMQALPWAAYCVPCHEAVDRGEIENEALDSELQLSEMS